MARSHFNWVAKVNLECGGVKGGHVTNAFNLLWSGTGTPTTTDLDAAEAVIRAFYNTIHTPAINKVADNLGSQHPRNVSGEETAFYDIDLTDPAHYFGSPVHVVPWTLSGSPSGISLPNQCAAVMSYRADYGTDPEHGGSTRPRAQDRGRIYLGPLSGGSTTTVTDTNGGVYSTLSSIFYTTVSVSMKYLHDQLILANWHWAVWSRVDQIFKIATQWALDDVIDTQRRRVEKDPLQTWLPF